MVKYAIIYVAWWLCLFTLFVGLLTGGRLRPTPEAVRSRDRFEAKFSVIQQGLKLAKAKLRTENPSEEGKAEEWQSALLQCHSALEELRKEEFFQSLQGRDTPYYSFAAALELSRGSNGRQDLEYSRLTSALAGVSNGLKLPEEINVEFTILTAFVMLLLCFPLSMLTREAIK